MKFYDNYGNIHKTALKANVANITTKIDNKMRSKLPGYTETIEAFHNATKIMENEKLEEDLEMLDEEIYDEEDVIISNEEAKSFDNKCEEVDVEVKGNTENGKKNKIEINYLHNKLILLDENNEVIASSDIDDKLTSGTLDKLLLDTLYPNENVKNYSLIKSLRNEIMDKTDPRRDENLNNLNKIKDVIEIDKMKNIYHFHLISGFINDNKC